jgi:ClpP class serine protease
MNNIHHTAMLQQPWLLMADHFRALLDLHSATAPVGMKYDGEYIHPQVEIHNGIAYLPIRGMLMKGASLMDQLFYGCYDVDLLAQQIQHIAEDPNVTRVLLHIDSPGGAAIGIGEVAQQIYDLQSLGKTVWGYSDGFCASGGYYFAAACGKFFASPSAQLGSISTYAAGVDSSKQWEKEGLERIIYRTGELKAVGIPGKPWTDEEKAAMKERVDHIDAEFKGFIRTHRPAVTDAAMNGNHWYAKHAPSGLHDGLVNNVTTLLEALYTLK